jgi:threonyl-tRNA synthetase
MATPVASTSQPAQLSALQAPHAHEAEKKPKEKKDKNAASAAYPLEVCGLFIELDLKLSIA